MLLGLQALFCPHFPSPPHRGPSDPSLDLRGPSRPLFLPTPSACSCLASTPNLHASASSSCGPQPRLSTGIFRPGQAWGPGLPSSRPCRLLSLGSARCPVLGESQSPQLGVVPGAWHVLAQRCAAGRWRGRSPCAWRPCCFTGPAPTLHRSPRTGCPPVSSQVWGDGAGLPKDKEHSVCFICRLGADKEQNTHSDCFQETAAGGGSRQGEQAPSQQAGLQVGFQEGAPPVPLSPGKGPAVSPEAGWGSCSQRVGEERSEERGGRQRGWAGLGCTGLVTAALQRPQSFLEPSISPFWGLYTIFEDAPSLGLVRHHTGL